VAKIARKACIEFLESRILLASSPSLLTDINHETKDSHPSPEAHLNGQVVFVAKTENTGRELWISDPGSPSGARLFADVLPGRRDSNPHELTTVNGLIVFWAKDSAGVDRLWSSDGTPAGTTQLSSTLTHLDVPYSKGIVHLNGRAYFQARDGLVMGLYSTAGDSSGIILESASTVIYDLTAHDGQLFFSGHENGTYVRSLWRFEAGSSAERLTPEGVDIQGPLFSAGDTLIFTADGELWRSNGTPEGTELIADLSGSDSGYVSAAAALDNGRIIFMAGATNVFSLNTDGSITGPLFRGFEVQSNLAVIGNKAYFGAADGNGFGDGALYETDGTATGTLIVRNFPQVNSWDPAIPTHLTAAGANLFFRMDDGSNGPELWVSDGTASGTALLADIRTGADGSFPVPGYDDRASSLGGQFHVLGNEIFFAAETEAHGIELWRSNGTSTGTMLVSDVNISTSDAIAAEKWRTGGFTIPDNAVEYNGRAYFAADDGTHGRELWVSDGTPAGTRIVADVLPGARGSEPLSLLVHDGFLYFVGLDNVSSFHDRVVYKTDGTAAGTIKITSAANGEYRVKGFENERQLVVFKDKVAFLAFQSFTDSFGAAVWFTDGSPTGAYRAGNIITPSTGVPDGMTVSGEYLYFSYNIGPGTDDLLRHDGTNWTVVVEQCNPSHLTDLNGTLLFSYSPGHNQPEQLWAVDDLGPRRVASTPTSIGAIRRVGHIAYISADASNPAKGYALWRTDGTLAGTVELTDVFDLSPPHQLTSTGGNLWFYAGASVTGDEPWTSDDTTLGTHLVADLNPGPASSYSFGYPDPRRHPFFVAGPDGNVYLQATTAQHGTELFRSDGTSAGTQLVEDFIPGTEHSIPGPFMRAGGKLFVAADHPQYGREWFLVGEDTIHPAITQFQIGNGHVQRSNPATITLHFSEPTNAAALIAASTIDDFVKVYDKANPSSSLSWLDESRFAWDVASNTLAIDLTTEGPGGSNSTMLANGRYELRINTAAITDSAGNPLADSDGTNDGTFVIDRSTGSTTQDFFRLGGDLDGDADVDLSDLSTLSTYFGVSDARGDTNGDGVVNLNDLSLLSTYYGTSLPAASGEAQAVAPFTPPAVEPVPAVIPPPPPQTTFTRAFQATNHHRKFKGNLLSLDSTQIDTSRKWKARIDWGDGSISTEKVVYNSKTRRWEVADDHKYRRNGSYTVTIKLI
jgi:ELWxxDGT repeat protein